MKKPLVWSDGEFPSTMYHVKKADNPWLRDGDSIFSLFKVGENYYACGEKLIGNNQVFAMAFHNTGSDEIYQVNFDNIVTGLSKEPVKTGFDFNELVYWGVWDGLSIKKLSLKSTYDGRGGITAVFDLTDEDINGLDNPYWSINPIWPTDLTVKILPPTTRQAFRLYNLAVPYPDGRLNYPKYLLRLRWEMAEGTTTVKNSYNKLKNIYYLNDAQFRFTQADIDRGYIMVKLYGDVHCNSASTDTSRVYKIYWK